MEEYLRLSVHDEFARRMEEENSRQNQRLKALERSVEQITKLTISVEKMATSTEQMANELKAQGARLKEIEDRPSKRWETVIACVITGIIGALISAVMSGILH